MTQEPIKFFELTFSQLTAELNRRHGRGAYHASAMFRRIYKNGVLNLDNAPGFEKSAAFLSQLKQELDLTQNPVARIEREAGLTKFVTKLRDGFEIESVIVPMFNHHTLCISSQVGCGMGCKFCETARLGFKRNLSVSEIIGQLYTARFQFSANIRNVVFMGMGEPLDNLGNVIQAVKVMEDQRGLDISKRYISVSTAGLVPGIEKLAALNWPRLNLAVSLNAPNDHIRSQLMPVNAAWPMKRLREALLNFPMKKNGAIYVEYVLIKGVNDAREHAAELARFLRPIKAKLNLIAYNPGTRKVFLPPGEEGVGRFLDWMVEEHVFVRKRSTKGRDIMAGCGQLGNQSADNKRSAC